MTLRSHGDDKSNESNQETAEYVVTSFLPVTEVIIEQKEPMDRSCAQLTFGPS